MIDIFVTVKDRYELATRSLSSLFECTDRSDCRLTICVDGRVSAGHDIPNEFFNHLNRADYVLSSTQNEGLGPTINRALAHIDSIDRWYEHPIAGDPSQVSDLICMCQDDLLYTPGWLPKLSRRFYQLENAMKLGFATGLECVEHKVKSTTIFDDGTMLKDWIRAAQMMARRSYWMSMWPIPRLDPETNRVRAKPNDGMGSGVDWWFIRNHENSVCRTGRTNLVIPGLIKHLGYRESTWLKRELPESLEDKNAIQRDDLDELARQAQELGLYEEPKS